MKQSAFIILLIIILSSCSNDLFDVLNKNNIEPAISKPNVTSFKAENEIIVDWAGDSGADSYCLYRDLNPDGTFAAKIYQGNSLSYIDDQTIDGTRYYYKLSKMKGLKEFDKSDCVMGVGSAIVCDAYENDDTKDMAKEFVNTLDANIFYYKDASGNTLEDTDWYWVTIGPRQYMTIRITLVSNLSNQEITFGLEGASPINIISNNTYEIRNNDYSTRQFRFVIAINRDNFLGSSSPSGGRLGFYQIQFVQINNLGL
jgi:hypothetical protein